MVKNKTRELVNLAGVSAFFGGKSASTIWRWVQLGLVPKPVNYQGKAYWVKDDLVKNSVAQWQPKMSKVKGLDQFGRVVDGVGVYNKASNKEGK
jgi:hypothetical protein